MNLTADLLSNASGYFVIENTGNVALTNLGFNATTLKKGSDSIDESNIQFLPGSIISLDYKSGSDTQTVRVNVNVPDAVAPVVYCSTITVLYDDLTPGDTFFLYLDVNSIESFDVRDDTESLTGNIMSLAGGPYDVISGTFVVLNNGNVVLDNIIFSWQDLSDGAGNNIYLSTASFDVAGSTFVTSLDYSTGIDTVGGQVSVSISSKQPSGVYTGIITVKDDDA